MTKFIYINKVFERQVRRVQVAHLHRAEFSNFIRLSSYR